MPRFKLTIEYDGTGIAGWQRQNDQPSVQVYLEKAIKGFCGYDTEVTGAGRTDAGVHATGQIAHVDVPKSVTPFQVVHGINFHLIPLTPNIVITQAQEVADDFHARFSATKRYYYYHIINRQARLTVAKNYAWHIPEILDVDAMAKGAALLVGHHDFTTFRSSQCQSKSPMKTLERFDVVKHGEAIHIYLSARSFLHHQVRNMVGSLRYVGNHKWSLADLQSALDARHRTHGGETAPAHGLTLTRVDYPVEVAS